MGTKIRSRGPSCQPTPHNPECATGTQGVDWCTKSEYYGLPNTELRAAVSRVRIDDVNCSLAIGADPSEAPAGLGGRHCWASEQVPDPRRTPALSIPRRAGVYRHALS